MKKVLSLLLGALLLVGCAAPKPEATVEKLMTAVKNSDSATMAKVMGEDNYNPEEDDILAGMYEISPELGDAIKEYNKTISYNITSSDIQGDTATVTADITFKDAGEIFLTAMGKYIEVAFTMIMDGASEEEVTDAASGVFAEAIETTDVKEITKSVTFTLVKNDKEWIIDDVTDEFLDVISLGIFSALEMFDE